MEHASEVGFCSLGEQAVARLTFYASRCNATASADVGGTVLVNAQLLKASSPKGTSHLLSGSRQNEFYFRFAVFVVSRRGADASHQWAACPQERRFGDKPGLRPAASSTPIAIKLGTEH